MTEPSDGDATGETGAPLVLIVDDAPDALIICSTALKGAGYRTATASSGAEALAFLETATPALIILDLTMPGLDGFATAHAIRNRAATAWTPILIATGMPQAVEEAARRVGGTAFCMKPIQPKRLVAEVAHLLGQVSRTARPERRGRGALLGCPPWREGSR
jgi:CheY-like chemotaxis protein